MHRQGLRGENPTDPVCRFILAVQVQQNESNTSSLDSAAHSLPEILRRPQTNPRDSIQRMQTPRNPTRSRVSEPRRRFLQNSVDLRPKAGKGEFVDTPQEVNGPHTSQPPSIVNFHQHILQRGCPIPAVLSFFVKNSRRCLFPRPIDRPTRCQISGIYRYSHWFRRGAGKATFSARPYRMHHSCAGDLLS